MLGNKRAALASYQRAARLDGTKSAIGKAAAAFGERLSEALQ
jgi:cytochrome c-type biogenesis protein CcmH/NrfG